MGSLAALLGGAELRGSLLGAVLHIALVKKQPSWLMRNSRPVLLEPSIRRAEAGVQFRRLMRMAEVRGALPPEMYAYRAQMPGHWAPLLLRWLVSWWVDQGHEVWVADLDESHAYNGIQRGRLESVLGSWFPGLGSWAGSFYGSLTARISTPRG